MNDPKRWLEDPDLPDAERFIMSGGDPAPTMSPSQRRRLASAVSGITAGAVVTSALLSTKIAIAALAVGAGSAASWFAYQQLAPPAPTESSIESPLRRGHRSTATDAPLIVPFDPRSDPRSDPPSAPPSAPPTDPPVERVPAVIPRPVADPPTAERVRRVVEAPRESSAVETPSSDPLGEEVAALEHARSLLDSDAGSALRAAQGCPADGQLAEERMLLIVDALVRLERRNEAATQAQALISSNPRGIYARRARRLIERERL